MRPWRVPVSHILLIILKISHIPKINMANVPKVQKAYCIPNIPKIDLSIPLNIYKNIPYLLIFLANIPVSLKPFHSLIGLQLQEFDRIGAMRLVFPR